MNVALSRVGGNPTDKNIERILKSNGAYGNKHHCFLFSRSLRGARQQGELVYISNKLMVLLTKNCALIVA